MAIGPQAFSEALRQSLVTVRQESLNQLHNGNAFETGYYWSNIAGSGFGKFLIENNSGSGILLDATEIQIFGEASGTYHIETNVTVDTAGTQQSIRNRRTGYAGRYPSVTVQTGGSHSGGNSFPTHGIPASRIIRIPGIRSAPRYMIDPGDNILITIQNTTSSGAQYDIGVTFNVRSHNE